MAHRIEPKDYTIDILYNVSSDVFAQGYDKLIEDNKSNGHIHFIKEKTVPKLFALPDTSPSSPEGSGSRRSACGIWPLLW